MSADRLLGLVLMAVSAGLFAFTHSFPFEAAVYPSAVLIAIFLLSSCLCLFPQSRKRVSLQDAWAGFRSNWRVPVMMMVVFAFIACIEPLGFYIALFLFVIISQIIMEAKNAKTLVLVSLLLTVVVYVIFSVGLQLNIPLGPLEF